MTEEQHAEAIWQAAGLHLDPAAARRKATFLTALRAYGDERAADMRERAAEGASYPTALPSWAQQAGLSMSDYISAWEDGHLDHNEAIRALPLQEPKQAPATVIEPAEPFGRESGLRPGFYEDDMP